MPEGANPMSKSRFEMILSVKEHEMHHRGQLMLIERVLGIVPHLTREMQARFASAAGANGCMRVQWIAADNSRTFRVPDVLPPNRK